MHPMKTIEPRNKVSLLERSIDKFKDAKVLVIGDIILDYFVWGDVNRISPEAPVPVVQVKRETNMLGGAANVIHNIATLGAKPILCGVIGEDPNGQEILRKAGEMGLRTDGIVAEKAESDAETNMQRLI